MRTCLYCGIAVEDSTLPCCPLCGKPLPLRGRHYSARTLTAERIQDLVDPQEDPPLLPPISASPRTESVILLLSLAIFIVLAALYFS